MVRIPAKGMTESEVMERLASFKSNDVDWRSGKVMGYVYDPGPLAEDVGKKAYMMYLMESALDPTIFRSLFCIERDLIAMAAVHLNGDEHVVGTFTGGGTESNLLAVKSARDYWRVRRPGLKKPEMIIPMTAHASLHKAADYFDVTAVNVPVDEKTFRADPARMKDAVTDNTIMMVASAPSYAHGVVDPIPEIAETARKNGLLMHVDACVGGFLLPYYRRLGSVFPDFDFTVPGVTSIALDFHKYGYTPKNASIILYRLKELRRPQIFACAKWPGYSVVNTAVQSSRTGGPMAAAWAVMNFIGDEGYLGIARRTREATVKLIKGIEGIQGLRLMANPDMCMLSFTSDEVNIFHIVDEMKILGWYVQPQLDFANSQKNIHISLNESSAALVDEFLKDLGKAVDKARTLKTSTIGRDMRILLDSGGSEGFSDQDISQMISMVGIKGDHLPTRQAVINEIINALPVEMRERMLTTFMNDIFTQA